MPVETALNIGIVKKRPFILICILLRYIFTVHYSSVTYPALWRCGVSCGRCGECASLKEMIHLQWETTASLKGDAASPAGDAASPAGDAVSPTGDLLASPNFGTCDTTRSLTHNLITVKLLLLNTSLFETLILLSQSPLLL